MDELGAPVINTPEAVEAFRRDIRYRNEQLKRAICDSKSDLLKAIEIMKRTVVACLDGQARSTASLSDRVGVLEDRVLELEKRLNMPPAA